MNIKDIVKANNMPVQTVELKDKTGKSRTYNASTYKKHGKAKQKVAIFRDLVKKIRKTRSDKGKKRAPYNINRSNDPNEKLKQRIKVVNKRLADAQKHLEVNASSRMKNILKSAPPALQAALNWAEKDKTKDFFIFETDKQGRKLLQFDESKVDELVKNHEREKLSKLKEMINGNNKTDYEDKRVGLYNAKSLTEKGREELREDAYNTFIKNYASEIGSSGMTREEYDEMWDLFNTYKKQAEAEASYSIFYSGYQEAVKKGLLRNDPLEWEKWFISQIEELKKFKGGI